MSQIPPFGYVIVQNVQVQRETAIDKERQLRREQAVEKDIAAQEDTFEHHVEKTKEVHPVNDQEEKAAQVPAQGGPREEQER